MISGALANLYAFMATTQPGDTVVVSHAAIAGHVTHHSEGAAGRYGLNIVEAPVDLDRYTIDVKTLSEMARELKLRLITLEGSLNLCYHPVAEIREIADSIEAWLMFDAAPSLRAYCRRSVVQST